VLLYCAASTDLSAVFEALTELTEMSVEKRSGQLTNPIKQIELNWSGHEKLLVQLFRLRDTRLAVALLGGHTFDWTIGELEIGPVDWWLEWLREESDSESDSWFQYQMASIFARFLNPGTRQALVTEFNNSGSKFRRLLAHSILLHRIDLTTDAFCEDAISFLLADLNRDGSLHGVFGHLLGRTATEQFVTERLLPLLPDAKPPLSENLRDVLRQAGSRHGRRYVVA